MDYLTKNKLLSVIVIVFFVLNVATIGVMWFTLLKKDKPNPPPPPADVFRGLIHILELNEQQAEKLHSIQEAHRSFMFRNDMEIRSNKKKLINEVFRESPNSDSVSVWIANISRLQANREEYIYTHLRKIRDLCDDRQKEIFKDFIEKSAPPPDGPPPMK